MNLNHHGRAVKGSVRSLCVIIVLTGLLELRADPLENWSGRLQSLQGISLAAVTHGKGTYVAVGSGGGVVVSADSINWTPVSTPAAANLSDVAFARGLFVAVGHNGTILTSTNALDWTPRDPGTNASLACVAFGNGVFVTGGIGFAAFSTDGETWMRASLPPNMSPRDIAFGQGRFVALSFGSAVLTSVNGEVWTFGTFLAYTLEKLAYGNGVFMTVDGYENVYTSSDGIAWTNRGYHNVTSPVFGNGVFVATAKSTRVYLSMDGSLWLRTDVGVRGNLGQANGIFFALDRQAIRTSRDALHWTAPAQSNLFFQAVIHADGAFSALGAPNARSSDGVHWTISSNSAANWGQVRGVAHGNGLYLATASYVPGVFTSADGLNWAAGPAGQLASYLGPVFGNGWFLTYDGFSRAVKRSIDGTNWIVSLSLAETEDSASDLTVGNNRFVVVGRQGKTWISSNAVDWTSGSIGTTNFLNGMSFANGRFIGVTRLNSGNFAYQEVLTSMDGIEWEIHPIASQAVPSGRGIVFCNGRYLAPGNNGVVYTSSNAVDWVLLQSRYLSGVSAFACDENSVIAVALSGLLQSDPFAPSPPTVLSPPESRSAEVGETVWLDVHAYGSSPLNYQWAKDGVPIGGATNALLAIRSESLADAGTYCVTVSNALGTVESDCAVVEIRVPSAPVIARQPLGTNIAIGGLAYFPVVVEGHQPVEYQWAKDGQFLAGATNAILAFRALSESDGGNYTVVIANAHGAVTSAVATVAVNQPAKPLILVPPASQTITNGGDVRFAVHAVGAPPLGFQWRRWYDTIPNATNDFLVLTNVQWWAVNDYSVTVSNAAGVASATAHLTVYTRPSIQRHPRTYSAAVGAPTVFSVLPGSPIIPPPAIQWYKDGHAIPTATNSTLTLVETSFAAAGSYTAVVSNLLGTVSSGAASLRVHPAGPLDHWNEVMNLAAMNNLTYVNGMFAALTDRGMSTSSNGVDWTDIEFEDPLTYRFLDVAYGGDQYVVVGMGPGIVFTYAGYPTQWAHTVAPIPGSYTGVAYGAGMFVAVGGHRIVTSFNVEDWVAATNLSSLTDATFGNGRFIVVGYYGIATSTDGLTWLACALPSIGPPSTPPAFSSVVFGNDRFVAVAQSHGIYSSEDGLTWHLPDTAILPGLKGVVFGDGVFVAYGGGAIYSSEDAVTWVRRNAWTNPLLSGSIGSPDLMAFGNGMFIHVAGQNTVFKADPLLKLAVRYNENPELSIWGMLDRSCRIECADPLDSTQGRWKELDVIELQSYPTIWTDGTATNAAGRFYRAISLPSGM